MHSTLLGILLAVIMKHRVALLNVLTAVLKLNDSAINKEEGDQTQKNSFSQNKHSRKGK